MVPRPLRHEREYHRAGVPDSLFRLLLLPDGYASDAADDELECGDVWRDLELGDGVVCGQGEEGLCAACEDR